VVGALADHAPMFTSPYTVLERSLA
jgi:hypothetical protein